ncbi:MAG: hypothetical protein V3R89_01025, partial [Thermoanaerobaculia bacterium]
MPEDAGAPRGLSLRPYPFEIATWFGLATAVVFLRSQGLRIDWKTVEYTIPPLLPVMAKSMLAGIALYALYGLARRRSPWGYLRSILSLEWLLLTARLWFAIALFTYTYLWLKVCIPLVNPRLWDRAFWRLDAALHFGFSPSLFSVELLKGTGLLPWIDLWYRLVAALGLVHDRLLLRLSGGAAPPGLRLELRAHLDAGSLALYR